MSWFDTVLPYAQKASAALNIPVSSILTHWGLESAAGTSRFAQEGNNLAGIKLGQNSTTSDYMIQGGSGAKFAKYASLDQFVDDYVRVLRLGYYKHVLTDDDPATPQNVEVLKDLANSPYDAGRYSGDKLLKYANSFNLWAYDGVSPVTDTRPTINGNTATISFPDLDPQIVTWTLIGLGALVMLKGVAAVFDTK